MIIQVLHSEIMEVRKKARNIAIRHFVYILLISISATYNFISIKNIEIIMELKCVLYFLNVMSFIMVMVNSGNIFIKTIEIFNKCQKIIRGKELV